MPSSTEEGAAGPHPDPGDPAVAGVGGSSWRRINRALHRDIGYACVALTLIYAISGVAVNHVAGWNPNYRIERTERSFAPIPELPQAESVTALVERLGLAGLPRSSFRPAPGRLDLFYDGWNVQADLGRGTALIERPRPRPLLRDANFLHLNHAKGLWTYVADLYAVLLALLALTGMLIARGRLGLAGRGKWFIFLGLAVPLLFLAVGRWR